MNWAAGRLAVENLAPVALLFDEGPTELARRLSSLIDGDDEIFHYEDVAPAGRSFRLLYRGIEFYVSVGGKVIDSADFSKIFCESDLSAANTGLTVALGSNLVGGQLVAPIALNLLVFAAKLATTLNAKAVAWIPSQLLSDVTYFATAVQAYAKGEAFPVLSTVKLQFGNDALQTTGLDWFSGQELELRADGLSQSDLMRRAVRIVHDIATNGAILEPQNIPDLDQGRLVRLEPSAEGDRVFAKIISDMNHLPV